MQIPSQSVLVHPTAIMLHTLFIHPAATYISLNNILTGVCSLALLWDCLVVGGQMSMSITADWNSYDSINVHGITLIGSGNGRDWHSLAFRPRNDRALERRWRWLVGWLLSLTWWRLLIFCIHLVLLGDWPRIQLLQGKATRIYVFSRHWAAAQRQTLDCTGYLWSGETMRVWRVCLKINADRYWPTEFLIMERRRPQVLFAFHVI